MYFQKYSSKFPFPIQFRQIIINMTIKPYSKDSLVSSKISRIYLLYNTKKIFQASPQPSKWLKVLNRNHYTKYLAHCCAGQCSGVQFSAEQCSKVQCSVIKYMISPLLVKVQIQYSAV